MPTDAASTSDWPRRARISSRPTRHRTPAPPSRDARDADDAGDSGTRRRRSMRLPDFDVHDARADRGRRRSIGDELAADRRGRRRPSRADASTSASPGEEREDESSIGGDLARSSCRRLGSRHLPRRIDVPLMDLSLRHAGRSDGEHRRELRPSRPDDRLRSSSRMPRCPTRRRRRDRPTIEHARRRVAVRLASRRPTPAPRSVDARGGALGRAAAGARRRGAGRSLHARAARRGDARGRRPRRRPARARDGDGRLRARRRSRSARRRSPTRSRASSRSRCGITRSASSTRSARTTAAAHRGLSRARRRAVPHRAGGQVARHLPARARPRARRRRARRRRSRRFADAGAGAAAGHAVARDAAPSARARAGAGAAPVEAVAAAATTEFVNLGDWLRDDDAPKDTRMVVAEQEPTRRRGGRLRRHAPEVQAGHRRERRRGGPPEPLRPRRRVQGDGTARRGDRRIPEGAARADATACRRTRRSASASWRRSSSSWRRRSSRAR